MQPGGANTLRAYYGALETSFIRYSQVPKPAIEELAIDGVKVPIATIELIAVMKAGAVINAARRETSWTCTRFASNPTGRYDDSSRRPR